MDGSRATSRLRLWREHRHVIIASPGAQSPTAWPAASTVPAASTPSTIGGLAPTSQPPVRTNSSQLPTPASFTSSSTSSPSAAGAREPRPSQPGRPPGESQHLHFSPPAFARRADACSAKGGPGSKKLSTPPMSSRPGRASETRLLEPWSISSTIFPLTTRVAGKHLGIQTNWTRIPHIPSMITVAMTPATTAPPTRNRSANVLLTPCAIMTERVPAARCARTKNAPSQ
jgi:hypothetical protein